jgi:flagellar hook-associated protein 1 FlgK
MSSSFFGISITSSALRAFEAALNITGHNLANVNTEGYSRQIVEFAPYPPLIAYGFRPFTVGSGTAIQHVQRVRDQFIEGRFLQTNFEGARLQQMLSTLQHVQTIAAEPGVPGISDALTSFLDAWHQLSAQPDSDSARLHLRLQAENLVARVRDTHARFLQLDAQLNQETTAVINQINDLARRIYDLNDQIRRQTATGATPNNLLDQRDRLVQELSSLVDISYTRHQDGTLSLYIHQHTLIDTHHYSPVPTNYDPATSTLTDGTKSILIRGGKLAGLLNGINALTTYRSTLNTFVNELRTQVNTLHQTGINLNGTTLIDFFAGTNGAGDFDLTQEIRSDIRNIAAGTSGAPGDGGLALAIAGLRDLPLAALGNQSLVTYYNNLVGQIGQDVSFYQDGWDTQKAVLLQLDNQRKSISSVNLDEELATMIRFQRSFQAAARALTIIDQTTEELIRSFGR